MFRPLLLALLSAAALVAAAPAQAPAQEETRPYLVVTGRATLELPPDKVEMTVGVSTQAAGSAEAARHNASAMEALLTAVKARLGDKGKLQSVGYRVTPRFEWDGKRNHQVGFQAVNQVKVTLKDVNLAGPILDAASQAGANVILGPSWGLADASNARIQVQEAALADALAQAQALAKAAGMSLAGLKNADFSPNEGPRHYMAAPPAMAARAAPETPVEPGMISLSASARCAWFLK